MSHFQNLQTYLKNIKNGIHVHQEPPDLCFLLKRDYILTYGQYRIPHFEIHTIRNATPPIVAPYFFLVTFLVTGFRDREGSNIRTITNGQMKMRSGNKRCVHRIFGVLVYHTYPIPNFNDRDFEGVVSAGLYGPTGG